MDVKITFNDFTVTGANQLNNVTIKLLKGEKGDPGEPTDAQVTSAVNTWLAAHPEATTTVQDGAISYAKLDSSLKATADDVSDLKSSLYGFNADTKVALLALLEKVAYVATDGQELYDALEDALYPPLNVDYITAVYTQSGTVYDTDTLDSLRPDLVVTAYYNDGTSAVITNYTLSGTLTEVTSMITVSYGGKNTTISVPVVVIESISAVFTPGDSVFCTIDSLDSLKQYLVVTATRSDETTETVSGYTLSGSMDAGVQTIAVSYGGKTDTFAVTVRSATRIFNGTSWYAFKPSSGATISVTDSIDASISNTVDTTSYALGFDTNGAASTHPQFSGVKGHRIRVYYTSAWSASASGAKLLVTVHFAASASHSSARLKAKLVGDIEPSDSSGYYDIVIPTDLSVSDWEMTGTVANSSYLCSRCYLLSAPSSNATFTLRYYDLGAEE